MDFKNQCTGYHILEVINYSIGLVFHVATISFVQRPETKEMKVTRLCNCTDISYLQDMEQLYIFMILSR